jgi:predicted lipid-binding transport protein (Tim44 family)
MKTTVLSLIFAFVLALFAVDADAARRFGGGGNLGKQRAAPTQKEATPAPAQAPAQAAPAGAAGAAGAAAKPSFMQRWGGMLAGLGIGVLLASLFGAQLGPIIGMILMVLLVAAVAFMLFRLFAGRRAPLPAVAGGAPGASPHVPLPGGPPHFTGIGSSAGAATPAPAGAAATKPAIDPEPFLRVAKTSFIRLQAANDAGDLDDIRDYTTPEMYAEIAMQVKERGAAAQRNEVVNLNAEMVDTATEGDYDIASVRFYGLMRENDAANPEPFDETWHVRKDRRDRSGSWLIAGIQQNP